MKVEFETIRTTRLSLKFVYLQIFQTIIINMSMDDLGFPFRPVHPGELLKDELEYRHLSQKAIAKQLGLSYTVFNEILNGKRPVTIDFALIMEAALGVPAYILAGMQSDYNLQLAQKDKKLNQRLAEIRKMAVVLY